MKKKIVFILAGLLFSTNLFSQDKPYRLGPIIGLPNLVGLNFEYVTTALNNKLAATIDFSTIKLNDSELDYNYSYFELGGNYYFRNKSKGLYGQVSYGRIGFTGNYNNADFGAGEGRVSLNMINLMIGAKWGNSFYLRPEIGFANFFNEASVRVEYTEPETSLTFTVEEEIPNFLKSGLIYNLSIGVAF